MIVCFSNANIAFRKVWGIAKMEKTEFNFWQNHSNNYLEMAFRTDHTGIVENPEGHGKQTQRLEKNIQIRCAVKNLAVLRNRYHHATMNVLPHKKMKC